MGSGLGFLAMSWCVEQRGPVFTAAFTPLVQIIVAGIDCAVLHEQIYLGRYPHAAATFLVSLSTVLILFYMAVFWDRVW